MSVKPVFAVGVTLIIAMLCWQNCLKSNGQTSGAAATGTASQSASGSPPVLNTTSSAQINFSSSVVGKVGADFIGFSYEKSILSQKLFTADNKALIQLFSNWGPGVLRIGGNSVNKTLWQPNGAGLTVGATSPADVDRLAGFLKATNWKVMYGVNGTSSSPSLSAAEATYVAQSLGDRLQDFEIGNEPDLYHSNGLEASSFSYADFLTLWASYFTAMKAAVPSAIFSGPVTASNFNAYTVPFASDHGRDIEFLTQHYYRANGQVATSTIDFLLTPDPKLPAELQALQTAATGHQISKGYRLAETNSFYNGGAPGVSNGFGTALWLIQYAFTLAQNGAEGANFHGGGNSTGYTPIANDNQGNVIEARAEYYGMLLFAKMGVGNVLATTVTGNAAALQAFVVQKQDGSFSIALVNNSRTDIAGVNVVLPGVVTQAQAILLTASSLDATTGMTFGGSAVGSNGTWSAATVYNLVLANSEVHIDVPAGSAYLLQAK